MTNKTKIKEKLLSIGFTLGCYDKEMDRLSQEDLNKVLDNMEYGSTDIGVTLNGTQSVVEVYHVDSEVDFKIITAKDYAKTYGRIFNKE